MMTGATTRRQRLSCGRVFVRAGRINGVNRDGCARIRKVEGIMRFVHISEVKDYWEALRGGRDLPYRSEIDPRGIERALEFAFVLERVAPQVARFRLAGMHLSDLMGMEVRGMPLTSFFTPKARQEVSDILQTVFSGPKTADFTLKAEPGFGKPEMQARMIILPLKSDLGDVSRALGCLMAEGPIGRAPRRFDLVNCTASPIAVSDRKGFRSTRHAAPQGFSEPAAAFGGPAPTAIRSRGHLKLVISHE